MRTYVVRICRFDRDEPDMLIGIVEDTERGEKKRFSSFEELWALLNSWGKEGVVIAKDETRQMS